MWQLWLCAAPLKWVCVVYRTLQIDYFTLHYITVEPSRVPSVSSCWRQDYITLPLADDATFFRAVTQSHTRLTRGVECCRRLLNVTRADGRVSHCSSSIKSHQPRCAQRNWSGTGWQQLGPVSDLYNWTNIYYFLELRCDMHWVFPTVKTCCMWSPNSSWLLHCALSIAAQCIVIGLVCGFVCLFACVLVCLWVCLWVCYHDNSKLRANWVCRWR